MPRCSGRRGTRGVCAGKLLEIALGWIVVLGFAPSFTSAAGVVAPQDRPALATRRAAQSVLLGIATAGKRLIAVGERGIVVYSDDAGRTWRQASVPVSVTLTAVQFPTEREGWAVGHYGVVIHSDDRGQTWRRQLDGETAARLALETAEARAREAGSDDRAMRAVAAARLLRSDGADKPFLDLRFFDAQHGIVVGAYNLIFRTADGGRTWQPLLDRVENPEALHLYAIESSGDRLYIAGEQGLFLRSDDRGETFQRLPMPYRGSFFAVAARESGEVVVAGLRGQAFASTDRGSTWRRIDAATNANLSVVKLLDRGGVLLAGEGGELLAGGEGSHSMRRLQTPPLPPINAVTVAPDGSCVIAGMQGAMRVVPNLDALATAPLKRD